jgi:hypothetical protein
MNLFVGSCSWYICYDRFGFITCNTRQVSFMKQENLTLSEHVIALSSFVGYHIVRVFVLFCFILYVYPRVEKIMFIFTLVLLLYVYPRVEKIMFIFTTVLLLYAFNFEIKVFRRCGILCFSIYSINAQFD